MKTLRVVSLGCVLAALLISGGFYVAGRADSNVYPARNFRIVYTKTFHRKGGSPELQNFRVRYVSSEGEWKEEYYYTAPVAGFRGLAGVLWTVKDGQYTEDYRTKTLHLEGEFAVPNPETFTAKYWKKSPDFIRKEKILGYTAYGIGKPSGKVETYRCAEFGPTPLKIVIHSGDIGDTVLEAVKIDFIEVTPEMFRRPDLPVQFDMIDQQIQDFEDAGNAEKAQLLRNLKDHWKAEHSKSQQ